MASRAGARVKRAALNLRLRICVLGARRIPAKDSSRTLRIPDHYRAKDFPGTCLADSFSPTNQKIRTRPIRPLLWPGSNRERWMRLAAWPCCVTSDGPSSNRSLTPQGCWQTTSTESRLNGQPEYSRRHVSATMHSPRQSLHGVGVLGQMRSGTTTARGLGARFKLGVKNEFA